MCSLQCSLHEVIKGEQTRVALDSRVTQQNRSITTIWNMSKMFVQDRLHNNNFAEIWYKFANWAEQSIKFVFVSHLPYS